MHFHLKLLLNWLSYDFCVSYYIIDDQRTSLSCVSYYIIDDQRTSLSCVSYHIIDYHRTFVIDDQRTPLFWVSYYIIDVQRTSLFCVSYYRLMLEALIILCQFLYYYHTYWHFARHSLLYVLSSVPHTGSRVAGHGHLLVLHGHLPLHFILIFL